MPASLPLQHRDSLVQGSGVTGERTLPTHTRSTVKSETLQSRSQPHIDGSAFHPLALWWNAITQPDETHSTSSADMAIQAHPMEARVQSRLRPPYDSFATRQAAYYDTSDAAIRFSAKSAVSSSRASPPPPPNTHMGLIITFVGGVVVVCAFIAAIVYNNRKKVKRRPSTWIGPPPTPRP
jgi:hypothetical protein